MAPRTPELIRNSTDLLVLSVLADGPLYGYAIIKQVAARSSDTIRLTPGVLYPLLHQLEGDGLLVSSWDAVKSDESDEAATGRRRKWYRLSAKGRRRLDQRVAAHRAYQALLESFLPGGAS
ncbi:MAG: PadR family transcriptional regulator [Planctomycetota bacterium]|jgi:DNA-binding PadR family transcriptional regulator